MQWSLIILFPSLRIHLWCRGITLHAEHISIAKPSILPWFSWRERQKWLREREREKVNNNNNNNEMHRESDSNVNRECTEESRMQLTGDIKGTTAFQKHNVRKQSGTPKTHITEAAASKLLEGTGVNCRCQRRHWPSPLSHCVWLTHIHTDTLKNTQPITHMRTHSFANMHKHTHTHTNTKHTVF